jgi:hypothetical protein
MSAEIWMGIAAGLTLPWVVLLIPNLKRKGVAAFHDKANALLKERNLIGIEQTETLISIAKILEERVDESVAELRDEFAKSALEGYLTGWENPERVFNDGHQHHTNVAKACYRYADAMMAERGKGGDQ